MMLRTALLMCAGLGLAMASAPSVNETQVQDVYWLTYNVSFVYAVPDDLTTYSWTNKTCIPHGADAANALEAIQVLPSPAIVWVASGDDPISQDEWDSLVTLPGAPKWSKNGDGRNTTFVESCMFSSPEAPVDCDPLVNCYKYMYTPPLQGYLNHTWLNLNDVACNGTGGNQIYPLNANWSGSETTPQPGYLAYSVSKQCKQNVFPNTIYRMQDPWGGWYAMHAHEGTYANVTNSILPPGFTVAQYTFPDDEYLLVNPVGDDCLLVILRDANNNGFYQVGYGNQTMWSTTNNTNCTDPQAQLATSPLVPWEMLPSDAVSS